MADGLDSVSLPWFALDSGSWRCWDDTPNEPEHDEEYGSSLLRAAARSDPASPLL